MKPPTRQHERTLAGFPAERRQREMAALLGESQPSAQVP